ncbi:MAG: hypothetical protein ACYSOD_05950 [Planctomycetota bacterium]|jgi:hypothetical protein
MNDVKTRLALVGRVLTAVVFLIAILGLFSNSYAKSKKFGKLQYNPEVIPRFASTEPMPKNMDIYFSGPADRPFAMIGIIKGTPFDPNIWRPIAEEAENIGKWRQMIHDYNDMLANPYFGYDMLDPDGKVFGKWISYERRTTIKMTRDNKITVYTPDVPLRGDPQRIGP